MYIFKSEKKFSTIEHFSQMVEEKSSHFMVIYFENLMFSSSDLSVKMKEMFTINSNFYTKMKTIHFFLFIPP